MGIIQKLHSIFGGDKAQPNLTNVSGEDRWGDEDVPTLSPDMPIDIRTPGGTPLFTGRLVSFNMSHLSVERLPEVLCLPTPSPGIDVTIRGYNKSMKPVKILAKVKESTKIRCTFDDLRLVPYVCSRSSQRTPLLDKTAIVYDISDTRMNHPKECQLLDISETGACVCSQYCYPEDAIVRLRVELTKDSGPISFRSQIVRATIREDGLFEYGLLFAIPTQWKLIELKRDLRDAQVELKSQLHGT